MNIFDYVNTRIGTENRFRFSNGNIYPITARPFGMAQFSLQTDGASAPWFFDPRSHSFEGIRLTHQASPWVGDFGQMLITPFTGEFSGDIAIDWSSYMPQKTQLLPYKIAVKPNRYDVKCELVPTCRGCIMRFSSERPIIGLALSECGSPIDFSCDGKVIKAVITSSNPVSGKVIKEYIYGELSEEPQACFVNENGVLIIKMPSDTVVRFAFGFISHEQTELSFNREVKSETFDELESQAKGEWLEYLSKIRVDGDEERKKTFYSCLYRAFLYPITFYEIDKNGMPVHFNADTQRTEKGYYYTDNGFWDTYRTVYPLFAILIPEKTVEMAEGFINHGIETEWLPKWITAGEMGFMPGTLIEAVIAECAVNGLIDRDLLKKTLELLKKNAYLPGSENSGRTGIAEYIKHGFVSVNYKESINQTMDSAYGDSCIAQVAEIAGDLTLAEELQKRSFNYKNLFDKDTLFFRAKKTSGEFADNGFSPYTWGGANCECSYFQNRFSAVFDIDGMVMLYGGKEVFENKLDEFFDLEPKYEVGGYGQEIHEMSEMACADFGQMAISNQPSFHIPWLYSAIGKREKTTTVVKNLINNAFNSGVTGFPGDEDNGTMACWYIFACLGLYPICPGSGEFVCCDPSFDKIEILGHALPKIEKNRITNKKLFDILGEKRIIK